MLCYTGLVPCKVERADGGGGASGMVRESLGGLHSMKYQEICMHYSFIHSFIHSFFLSSGCARLCNSRRSASR